MGKRRPGGRKNFLRKITAEYCGYSRNKKHGYYTEQFLNTVFGDNTNQVAYKLIKIEIVIKFLHPSRIPVHDPRRKAYEKRLAQCSLIGKK